MFWSVSGWVFTTPAKGCSTCTPMRGGAVFKEEELI